ncbi:YbgC/FadM family acyl-CoA thioesterase [Campylobacter sp. FMV-PI01]|uniref:YbgC/FadM family acyl-CoA thioesterase n=1 Tax=Campylobacter portucalensis TaxID=2608384 RepID=A0A6L5WIM6_9BACT|nr:YbgC/FadM family acyl-CoA thioesterase [Campylobacter portucalensis]MSN96107.1 YbgC/FadM family acyl-CoA thioesterase [Campylobacter portucalensis]
MKIRIYYEDSDAAGITYHANYIKYCERARSEIFFNQGYKFTQNRHFVVTKIEAKFIKPSFIGDLLEVKSKILELKKTSLTLKQEIFKDDELIFQADIKVGFLVDKKPARMDKKLIEILNNFIQK